MSVVGVAVFVRRASESCCLNIHVTGQVFSYNSEQTSSSTYERLLEGHHLNMLNIDIRLGDSTKSEALAGLPLFLALNFCPIMRFRQTRQWSLIKAVSSAVLLIVGCSL